MHDKVVTKGRMGERRYVFLTLSEDGGEWAHSLR